MYENRSITAVIIGVVSLTLIAAAWFYLARNPGSGRAGQSPARRGDPYSSYYRDMGQIADSMSTPKPAPAQTAPAAGPGQPLPGQPLPGPSIPGQPVPGMVPGSQPGLSPVAAPPSAMPGR